MVKDGDSSTLNWPTSGRIWDSASSLQVQFAWDMYIFFYTIVVNYNEPPAAAQAHIHADTRIYVSKYSYLALRSIGLRQVAYEAVASPIQV